MITYVLPSTLTQYVGTLSVELQAYTNDTYLAKGVIIPLKITKSIGGTSGSILDNTISSFGEMYVYNNQVAQSIPVNASIHTKLTTTMNVGDYKNCTIDITNRQIVIVNSGMYYVTYNVSSVVDTNNTVLYTALFKNDVEITKAHLVRNTSINSPASGSMSCMLSCSPNDILDIRVRHDKSAPVGLTLRYMNFNVMKIV